MSYASNIKAGDACIDDDCIGVLVDRGFVMVQKIRLAFDEQRLLSCSQCGRNVATAIIPVMPTSEA